MIVSTTPFPPKRLDDTPQDSISLTEIAKQLAQHACVIEGHPHLRGPSLSLTELDAAIRRQSRKLGKEEQRLIRNCLTVLQEALALMADGDDDG